MIYDISIPLSTDVAGWPGDTPYNLKQIASIREGSTVNLSSVEMSDQFYAANGAGSLQIGTPNILSLAPMVGSVQLVQDIGIDAIRDRSLALSEFIIRIADELLVPMGFGVVTPRDTARRGGHVALSHPLAKGICTALRQNGVVPDFRPPNIVRLAPSALYNTFDDCLKAVCACQLVLENGLAAS